MILITMPWDQQGKEHVPRNGTTGRSAFTQGCRVVGYGYLIPKLRALPITPGSRNYLVEIRYLTLFQFKKWMRASLVVQWLRIRLPMQGTQVQSLVWEDPTCRGATKPMHHNHWACTLEPASHNYWARVPQILKSALLEPVLRQQEKPLQWEAWAPQRRVAPTCHN